MPLDKFFLLKVSFAFQGVLWFYANSKMIFSVFDSIRILIEISSNLCVALGSVTFKQC